MIVIAQPGSSRRPDMAFPIGREQSGLGIVICIEGMAGKIEMSHKQQIFLA
jgi:hypothetical protein